MEFDERNFCHLYGSMWVNIHTCEKMLVLGDTAVSLDGLVGKKIYLPKEQVEELCRREDEVDNYLKY